MVPTTTAPAPSMDPALGRLLTELVEKTGLLRRDLQHRGALKQYEARVVRIEQKVAALARHVAESDPELAQALRTAWHLPARSLAFRNAKHQATEDLGVRRGSADD